MRSWGLVACVAALTISSAASATGGLISPAGLVDAEDAGEASTSMFDQSDMRIAPELRVRWNLTDRYADVSRSAAPARIGMLDIRKQRRQGMMADYHPVQGSGFFLSAGWRKSTARMRWVPGMASKLAAIFSPTQSEPLRVATNIARRAPTMLAGWEGALGKDGTIGLSAGALQETVRGMRSAIASPIGPVSRMTRVGALAQVNLGFKF